MRCSARFSNGASDTQQCVQLRKAIEWASRVRTPQEEKDKGQLKALVLMVRYHSPMTAEESWYYFTGWRWLFLEWNTCKIAQAWNLNTSSL